MILSLNSGVVQRGETLPHPLQRALGQDRQAPPVLQLNSCHKLQVPTVTLPFSSHGKYEGQGTETFPGRE